VTFSLKNPIPIAESPKGTLTVSKTRVALGDKMNFNVNIDPKTKDYPGIGENFAEAYNIDSVGLWRRKVGDLDDEFVFYRNVPPIASGDSTAFNYEWTPEGTDAGKWEYAALVNTKFPVPHLEIAEDSIKEVEVGCFSAAQKGAQKVGPQAEVCADEWTGTSGHTLFHGESIEAHVTWKKVPFPDGPDTTVRYEATGSFVYHYLVFEEGGCTVTPTTFTIHPQSAISSNSLFVDYARSPEPPVFSGNGIEAVELTVACPDDPPFTVPASLSWFSGVGSVSADGITIEGSNSNQFGSSAFHFVRP
jgi:hypothetical protein